MVTPPAHSHICWGSELPHEAVHSLLVRGLSVNYGPVCALNDISFEIDCGHTLAVMGPNGAGKSTLINAIAGLLKPKSGEILWSGAPLRDTPGEIAYLPQRSNVDWSFPLTVRDVVEMGRYPSLGPWRSLGSHDRDIVDKSLDTLNLHDLAGRQIGALSGGQQQRVFLARALAQEAHLLLLDEPFAGLDSPTSEVLGELLHSLAHEGRLIIVSHHDLNTVRDLFGSVMLLRKSLVAFGKCADVLTPELIRDTYHGGSNPLPPLPDSTSF